MQKIYFVAFFLLLSSSCTNYLTDPYALAPKTANSKWSEEKSTLVSAKDCEMDLPENFEKEKLTLAEIIDTALRNSPQTKMTWADARSKAAAYAQSMSDYFPSLDFTAFYLRERQTFFDITDFIPFYQTQVNPELDLNYTLLDFGRRRNASLSARQNLYYADATHNRKIQQVVQEVTKDYYDYIFERELYLAREENLKNAEASLDAAETRFKVGVGALGDVAQAKTDYLENKINFIEQKQRVHESYAKLATSMGIPANRYFQVVDLPSETKTTDMMEGLNELIAKAQEQRQDFLATQAAMRSKLYDYKKAKSDYWPTVDGSFTVGKTFYDGGRAEDYHFSAQVNLNFSLFRGFFYKNAVKKAKANLEKAKADLIAKELAIVEDVTITRSNVKKAANTLEATTEYLKAAKLRYKIALENYQSGTGTILDVLSSQSSLADARAKETDGKKEWYMSLVDIAFATGSLCSKPLEFK